MYLGFVLASILACGGGGSSTQPLTKSRVDAVAVTPQGQEKDLDAFCEVRKDAATAPTFSLPPLESAEPPRENAWTWYSLWATWCVPCIEEMPLLKQWDVKLKAEGAPTLIRFVSVDANAADLRRYTASHPDTPPTLRVEKQESVASWFSTLGLDSAASIPIHIFVDPKGRTRCVRVGAVSEADYGTIKYLVSKP